MIGPKSKKQQGSSRAQLIKHEISDLQRIDQRVKHGIRAIKERLRAAKDAECNVCPILEREVQRQGQQSKEKDRQIIQLNLKMDRISQHIPYTGPHSARKADLQTKRETLTRNANALLSDRKPPIQEIYRIEQRLPEEMEQLRAIEERTQLLRSREKRQREVIKRLSSINKLNHRSQLSPNRQSDSREEEDISVVVRKDDTLRSFKERLAVVDGSLGDEFTSEFEGASFTTINDKCNTLNNLISDLKSNNEVLTGRNAYLQKQANKLKEQINQKDSQIITLNQEKLLQEKHMMGKLMGLTDALQELERQHQGCKRNLQYYQNKSATLQEALIRDRQKYEQQISSQTEQLMAALAKLGQLDRVRNERDELKGQVKEEVIRRLALIQEINMLNKQNYTLKLTGGSLNQQIQELAVQNQQLKLLIHQRNQQIKNEKAHHTSKITESQQIRSGLETLCHQLQQQNQALKQSNNSIRQEKQGQQSETIKFLQEKIKRAHSELQAKENTIDSNEKSISELKWQITKLNRTLEQQTSTNRALQSDRIVSGSQITMLTRKCDDVSAELQQMKSSSQRQATIDSKQIATLMAEIQTMKDEASRKDEEFKQFMAHTDRKVEENRQLKNTFEQSGRQHQQIVISMNKQIEEFQSQRDVEGDKKSLLITKMKIAHDEVQGGLRASIQGLEREINELKAQNKQIKDQYSIASSQLAIVRQACESKLANDQVIIEQLQCKSKSLESQIKDIHQKWQKAKSSNDEYAQQGQELTRKIMEVQVQLNQKSLKNQQSAKAIANLQKTNAELKSIIETDLHQRQAANERIRSLQQNIEQIQQSHEYQLRFFSLTNDNLEAQILNLRTELEEQSHILQNKKQQKVRQNGQKDNDQLQQLRRLMAYAEIENKRLLDEKDAEINARQSNQQNLRNKIERLINVKEEVQAQARAKIQSTITEQREQLLRQQQMMENMIRQLQDQHNKALILAAKAHQDQMNQIIFNQNQKIRQIINENYQLSRNNQLQRLEYDRKLAKAGQQIGKLGLQLKQAIYVSNQLKSELDQKEAIITQIKNQAIHQQQSIQELIHQNQRLHSQIVTNQTRTQSLQLQLRQINNDFMRVSEDKEVSHMLVSRQKQELFAQRLKIDEIQNALLEAKNVINEKQLQNSQLKRQYSQLREQLRWLQSQIDMQHKEIQALQTMNENLNNSVSNQYQNKQALEKQVLLLIDQVKSQSKIIEERESELKNVKDQYKSHAFQVEYLSAKMEQIAKKLLESKQQYKDLQDYYAKKNQRQVQSMEQMRKKIANNIEKINKKQQMISQKQGQNKVLKQQLQNQNLHIQQLMNKIQEERQSLYKKLIVLQDKMNISQRQISEGQSQMARCMKQHSQALQMLQQQIEEREVQIQHKDNKYFIQTTNKSQKIEQLEKQLKEAKKMLQQELVQRENYIRLNEKQIERININLRKQIETLKRDGEQAKRILQVEVIERQTEIRGKDIKILDLQSKHIQDMQALKKENDEAKSLLQQQIMERQAEISNKDLKMGQQQTSHTMQINKLIANYEEQKRLLQELIIERQAELMEYDLKFNQILVSNQKQKERAAQNMVACIDEIQRKMLQRQRQLQLFQSQIAQLHEQNSSLKTKLNTAYESIGNHEVQIERLIQSHEISQNLSGQNLQKVRNLEHTLTQKLNIPLGSLAENEATLSLALESVHLIQHDAQLQQEEPLFDFKDSSTPRLQSPLRNQEQPAISCEQKCHQLQDSIKQIHQQNQQTFNELYNKFIESQSIIKSLEVELDNIKRKNEQERQVFTIQNNGLNTRLVQLTSQLQESKTQVQQNAIKFNQQIIHLKQLKMLQRQQLLKRIEEQKTEYEKQIERIECENSQLYTRLQQNGYKLKDAEQKLQKNTKKYEQSQNELYELESIFINHKINLQQVKIQNKTLKQRLELVEKKAQQNRSKDERMIIDENDELIEQLFEELLKRYQVQTQTKKRKLDQYEGKLNRIFEKIKQLRSSIARKANKQPREAKYRALQIENQDLHKQLIQLKSDNGRLQNELTLAQLASGQLILDKEQQITKLCQQLSQLNQLKDKNHPERYQKEMTRQGKLRIRPVSSFKIQEHEHPIQQTPKIELYSQGSLIDHLRQLVQSPEHDPIEFPSEEDIFNVITLYLGDFEEGAHELRHEYKHLLDSKTSLLHFVERLLVQMKKKNEIEMQVALKKPLAKVKSEEFIPPPSLPNVPIQALLQQSSNNSSNNKLPFLDSPIVEIEEEDGQALITEVKQRTGSEKRMSIILAKDISQLLSDSEKQDEIQEILGISSPGELELSQKSESARLIGSQLSLKSSRSVKQTDDHYNNKMKNSLMMAKLRKKK